MFRIIIFLFKFCINSPIVESKQICAIYILISKLSQIKQKILFAWDRSGFLCFRKFSWRNNGTISYKDKYSLNVRNFAFFNQEFYIKNAVTGEFPDRKIQGGLNNLNFSINIKQTKLGRLLHINIITDYKIFNANDEFWQHI